MHTIKTGRGVVTGADHRRLERPGQDAAATIVEAARGFGVAVVCDGCGSTPAAQVGAELGARLFARAIAAALAGGAAVGDAATWDAARAGVAARLAALVGGLGDAETAVHELLLFTIVAAAVDRDHAAVWVLGDGHAILDGRAIDHGPFADNRPPYLGYDLLGDPRPASLVIAPARAAGVALVATDGAGALPLAALADDARLVAHPDALRRYLALRARGREEIDWAEQRVVRTPAELGDDCAIAILRWSVSPATAQPEPPYNGGTARASVRGVP